MEENKDKKTSTSGRLQLKKTINAGQIKQSFSHGRSRSVSVEVKKRRTLTGFSKDEIIEQPKSTETDSENNFLSKKDSNLGKNESDETKNLDEINEKDEKKVIKKKPAKNFNNTSIPEKENDSPEKHKSPKLLKTPKSFENRRQGKLTISQALNDDNEKVRSLAAIKRAREKAKQRVIPKQETLDSREKQKKEIVIPDVIAVNELASRLAEKSSNLIKGLMKLGVMATINQTIDADTAELLVMEFGHIPKRVSESDVEVGLTGPSDSETDLITRPPVVTVMGHVDHGKTSLLDVIREKKVAATEAGGITQHIGSYIVEAKKNQMITFIDTPGHAAFSEMRARGSNITDVIILVVAADDSVNEQTIEAISHAKASGCPIIVAVNKIDLPTSNPQKVETDLMSHEIISESMGGQNVFVKVSAKTKEGIDDLLDSILLQSEILELKANPNRSAEGTVIESKIEKGKGTVVSILIQNGTLTIGDIAVVGKEWGKVRAMYNDSGEKINKALPSYPVELLGLSGTPDSGDKLVVVDSESRAREVTQYRSRMKRLKENSSIKRVTIDQMIESASQKEKKIISIIIKADVHGSKEAIEQSLNKMESEKTEIKIIHTAVGEVNESDVTLAIASQARIFGFNVKANSQAKVLSKREGVKISSFSIIYEVLDEAQKIIEGMEENELIEKLIGKATVKQVFQLSDSSKVAGCAIQEGKVTSKSLVKVYRGEELLQDCEIESIRREKDQVKEVASGLECGIVLSKFDEINQNDRLEFYLREKNEKKP
ncbi:MAG: translation initiation factor IF-2 [Alphaproteobacteria bacterium]